MKTVVIGRSGRVGSKVVGRLAAQGHDAVAASPTTGVDISKLRRRVSYANVVWTLCVFMLLGGGAYAASSFVGSDGQIHGCVGKHGELSVHKPTGHCKSGQREISWSQRGPRGISGARGIPDVDLRRRWGVARECCFPYKAQSRRRPCLVWQAVACSELGRTH